MKTFRLTCASALVLVFAQVGGAYALDPDAAAKAFLTGTQTATAKSEVTFGSAIAEGSDIVVRDVRISAESEGTEITAGSVAEVRLINVSEIGNGQYAAESAIYSDSVIGVDGVMSITVPSMIVNNLKTRDASADTMPMPVTYTSAAGDNMSIMLEEPVMTIKVAKVRFDVDEFMGELPKGGSMAITGIDVPLSAFPPGPTSPQALGYEGNLVFDVTASGQARYESSGFSLTDLTISGDQMGSISLSLDLDNYPNLINTAEPNPMEMLNIVLNSVSLKYTDDSFATRVLDMMASQQGIEREQFTQQMSMALPFMLSAINNPDFQTMVADAAGKFLNDPGTIEISAKPGQPMSAAQIMGIVQSAPQTLPDELNVTIQAR